MRTFVTALGTILLNGAMAAGAADSKPAPLKRTSLATHEIAPAREVSSVPVARIEFAPRQPTAKHQHPMPVIGYVLKGEFIVKIQGQRERRYTAGQSLYEPANVTIERFDNPSKTEPAVLLAQYLAGPGADRTHQVSRPVIAITRQTILAARSAARAA